MIRAAVPEWALPAIRERARSVELAALESEPALDTLDFLVPTHEYESVLRALPGLERLSVVQSLSAGVDWLEPLVPVQATLCSARGARDGPVAEWVVGALLGTTTRLLEFAHRREWEPDTMLSDLGGQTVLIVGMGSIGHRVASLLEPFDTQVIGVVSRARDDLHGIDELPTLLGLADAVVVLAPLTDATRGLIGAAELAAMRDGALLINAGRGPVVDREALAAEAISGRLRVVLDVTDPEPLPADDPLWTAAGTLCITPHFAGGSALGSRRAAELAGDQLARFVAGEPLRNVVRAPDR